MDNRTPAAQHFGGSAVMTLREQSVAEQMSKLPDEIEQRGSTAIVTQEQPSPPEQPPPSLADLAAQFRATEAGVVGGVRQTLASQIRCGELLQTMQARVATEVGAGFWGAWVELNCGVTLRQVQRYIRKAKEFRELDQKLGDGATAMSLLSQRDLQKLDSKPKRSAKKKPAK